ncbi:MAG TPA: UDP-N-acetylmuramate dehydrogenase [Mycobacteriales bacterium]
MTLLDCGVEVVENQPIGPWTTLGVGGSARWFVEPRTPDELARVLGALGDLPLLVLGRGSNMLVSDDGWPGVALRLGAGFKWQRRSGLSVSAGGGTSMPALAAWLATEGLSGLEFAAGIPATVGGSVRMNAGAHGGQTADALTSVTIASPAAPDGAEHSPADLSFSYRHSALPERSVVVAAAWTLREDDRAAIRARLDELRAWRRATQPLRQRNCGSVFTNPPGDSAGRLIEAAGLKGRSVGGATVSEKHANFIVVEPGRTTARDVVTLIRLVRDQVAARGGPLLVPEVRLVGFAEAW